MVVALLFLFIEAVACESSAFHIYGGFKMNNLIKVFVAIVSSITGLTDREISKKKKIEPVNQVNQKANKLAKDGLIIRYKPVGEKHQRNFPLSVLDSLNLAEHTEQALNQIKSLNGEEKDAVLEKAIGKAANPFTSNPDSWKLLGQIEAESAGKTFDEYMRDLLISNASNRFDYEEWKFALAQKANSSEKSPEKVIEEEVGKYLVKVLGETTKTSS
jgi:hypothetical protein